MTALVIAIIFVVLGISYGIYRVEKKEAKFNHFSIYLGVICFISITIYVLGTFNIKESTNLILDIRNQKISLEKLQTEAYATIDAVQKVGKLNLKLAAELATRLGYVGSSFTLDELINYQNEINESLDSLKVGNEEKEKILNIITNKIKTQLAYDEIRHKIVKYIDNNRSHSINDRNRIINIIKTYFRNYEIGETRNNIINFLKSENIPIDSSMIKGFDNFEYFIKTGKLLNK